MSNKDDLRSEYPSDLIKSGERGRYAQKYKDGTNVVLLDPDLHEKFPDSRSVNNALRDYLQKTGSAT